MENQERSIEIVKKLQPFIDATIAFYTGKPDTGMTDKEWDELRVAYKAEYGEDILDRNEIKGLISVKSDYYHDDIEGISKEQCEGDLRPYIEKYIIDNEIESYHLDPKYDGGSLIAYYLESGDQSHILSDTKGDGIDQTEKLSNHFPKKVPAGIRSIQAELVVSLDEGLGGLTRNKANGLINSKHMQDEVDELAQIRIFKLNYYDRKYDYNRMLNDLKTLEDISELEDEKWRVSDILLLDEIPLSNKGDFNSGKFLVDGVVIYSDKGIHAFKFYYNEAVVGKVGNIDWRFNPEKLSYSPVIELEEGIVVEDTNINNVSCNGVNKLFELCCGIGSEIEVIKANSTIPKVLSVVKSSEHFNIPKCQCCDEQMFIFEGDYAYYQNSKILRSELESDTGITETSQFGNSIKCINPFCQDKEDLITGFILDDEDIKYSDELPRDQFMNSILTYSHWFFGTLLNIDRFNAKNAIVKNYDEIVIQLMELLNQDDLVPMKLNWIDDMDPTTYNLAKERYDKFYQLVEDAFYMTDLQWTMFNINVQALYNSIIKLKNNLK